MHLLMAAMAALNLPNQHLLHELSFILVPCLQVKAAEHVVTGHQVAIKILNRRKIRSMDMDEKGASKDHCMCHQLIAP